MNQPTAKLRPAINPNKVAAVIRVALRVMGE